MIFFIVNKNLMRFQKVWRRFFGRRINEVLECEGKTVWIIMDKLVIN